MKKYSVIIVGAGPAGLACAQSLGKEKKEVLVLEKNRKVGPKICAGGLTLKTLKLLDLPPELLEAQFKQMNVFIEGKERKINYEYPLVTTVSREKLGEWMAAEAKASGAEIMTRTHVKEVKENSIVTGEGEEIFFDYLVGADGSNSLVRKHLKLGTDKKLLSMMHKVPGKFDLLEVFLDNKLLADNWTSIFPCRNYAMIGITGIFRRVETFRPGLAKWLEIRGIEVGDAKLRGFPINCDYRGHQFGNIFLVGDAGGFASWLTGEGIYQAVLSGQEAALKIIDHRYPWKGVDQILRVKRDHEKIKNLLGSSLIRGGLYSLGSFLLKNNLFQRKAINKIG